MSLSPADCNHRDGNDLRDAPEDGCRNGCRSIAETGSADAAEGPAKRATVESSAALPDDPELRSVIASWADLSRPIKDAIVALCRPAGKSTK
ncbi:MAG: hypothetical protein DWQ34_22675 [Planctomycetota bacterium]|nr:MAG: hypothetical protein DWQ34_22675 [Planctomycetota bacterium]REK33020.1 MAG: hypothetical protein DWQ45_15570 [Planctomycetota bacterium]